MGLAARVAGGGKRTASGYLGVGAAAAAVGLGPLPGPGDPIGLKVELCLGGTWTDVTPHVRYAAKVNITRGKADETSKIQPQTCALTINNRDGRFSPRNPVGPYYGLIGRNTPIRVSRLQNGIRRYRFHGEVPSWPTTWDISGKDVYTPIQAAGMLRRLAQGEAPVGSAMRRGYTLGAPGELMPVAYWPCEDGPASTSLASGLAGGQPMTLSGQARPTLANSMEFVCSDPLPLLSASIWTGTIPAHPADTDNVLRFLMGVPATGAFDTGVVARLYTTGHVARLDLEYGTIANGSLRLLGYDIDGNTLIDSGFGGFKVNGLALRVSMELRAAGADITWAATILQPGLPASQIAGTLAATAVGTGTRVVINPDGHLDDTAIGHISYQGTWDTLFDLAGPLNAWLGESPDSGRFMRLCAEQGVPAVLNAGAGTYADATVTMGYQLSDTFTNLIEQVPDTGLGLLHEARDQMALVQRTRVSLYNQTPHLTLDYAQHQLSGIPAPVDDDQLTRNDVTVTRINASSARQTLTAGALSIQAPPNGVGDYPDTPPISLGADGQLADQAGWRLHMGTVDQPRYPSIPLNLRHPAFTSNLDLMNAAMTLDIGDRVALTSPPAWMPPDPASLILQGYSESLGTFEHDMVLNTSPEDPYHAALLEDPVLGRADTDGSTLSGAYGAADVTVLVATTNPASPLWTTSGGEFPFDVAVAGERMTVTNVAGSSSPQTFTVTRSVNGVAKPQLPGADVRLWQPMIPSL